MALIEGTGGSGGAPLTEEEVEKVVSRQPYTPPTWRQRQNVGWNNVQPAAPAPLPKVTPARITVSQRVNNAWDGLVSTISEFGNTGRGHDKAQQQIVDDVVRWTPNTFDWSPQQRYDDGSVNRQEYQENPSSIYSPLPRNTPTPTATPTAMPTAAPPSGPMPQEFYQVQQRYDGGDSISRALYSMDPDVARELAQRAGVPVSSIMSAGRTLLSENIYNELFGPGKTLTQAREDTPVLRFGFEQYEAGVERAQLNREAMQATGGDMDAALGALFKGLAYGVTGVANPINAVKSAKAVWDAGKEVRAEARQRLGDTPLDTGMDLLDRTAIALEAGMDTAARAEMSAEIPALGAPASAAYGATLDALATADNDAAGQGYSGTADYLGAIDYRPDDEEMMRDEESHFSVQMKLQRDALEFTSDETRKATNEVIQTVNAASGGSFQAFATVAEMEASSLYNDTIAPAQAYAETMSRFNAPTGADGIEQMQEKIVMAAVGGELYEERAVALRDLALSPNSPLPEEARSAASDLARVMGDEGIRLQNLTAHDIFVETVNPLRDLGALLLFDPLMLVEGAFSLAKMTPKWRRIVKGLDEAQKVASPNDLRRAADISNLPNIADAGKTIDATEAAASPVADLAGAVKPVSVDDEVVQLGTEVERYAAIAEATPEKRGRLIEKVAAVLGGRRTIQAEGQLAAERSNTILNYLSLGVEESMDFSRMVKTFIENAEDLVKPMTGFIQTSNNGRTWNSKLLFTKEAEEVRQAFRALGDEILPILNAGENIPPSVMVKQLEGAAMAGTIRRMGGESDVAGLVPIIATGSKIAKKGDKWVVNVVNEAGDVVKVIPAASEAQAKEYNRDIAKFAKYEAERTEGNFVRERGQAMRQIASKFYITGTPSVIINNVSSFILHSMWDDTFTLMGKQNAEKQLGMLTGAASASRRIGELEDEAIDMGGLAAQGMRSGGAERTSGIGKAYQKYEDAATYRFGGDVYYGRLAGGEGSANKTQSAKTATDAMIHGWRKTGRQVIKELSSLGLPPAVQSNVERFIRDIPYEGIDDMIEKTFKYLDGVTTESPLSLDDLGDQALSSLTPEAKYKISGIMREGVDALEKSINAIREDMSFFESMMVGISDTPVRKTFTDKDLMQDSADVIDDYVQYGKYAEMSKDEVRKRGTVISQQLIGATNGIRDLLVDLPNSNEAYTLAMDITRKLESMTISTRSATQDLLDEIAPKNSSQWDKFFKKNDENWKSHLAGLDRYRTEISGQLADLASGRTSTASTSAPSAWDRAKRYEEEFSLERVQSLIETEPGAAFIMQDGKRIKNPDYTAVIEANQMMVDYFAEGFRTIVRRFPSRESFDFVIDAEKNVQLIGSQANGRVEKLRKMLREGTVELVDFYTRRNQIWREATELSGIEYRVAGKALADNAVEQLANSTKVLEGVDRRDPEAVKAAVANIQNVADAVVDDVARRPFKPPLPGDGTPDSIREEAATLLGLSSIDDAGKAKGDTPIFNFLNSDKVQNALAGYNINLSDAALAANRIEDLSPQDMGEVNRAIRSYALETGKDLPGNLGYLKMIADDDLAKMRVSNPMSRGEFAEWGIEASDDVYKDYNRWTQARKQITQGVDPTVPEFAQFHLEKINDGIKALTEAAALRASETFEISDVQRAELHRFINTNVRDASAKTAQGALNAAKDMSSFTMINHSGNGTYWDDAIGLFAPYHFFFTRSGKNMLERMAFTPGRSSAATSLHSTLDRRDEQRGVAGTRFSRTWDIPFLSDEERAVSVRYDPARAMPFVPSTFALNWTSGDRDLNGLQRLTSSAGRMGINAYPFYNSMAGFAKEGMSGLDLAKWTPQTWIGAMGVMATGAHNQVTQFVHEQSPEWAQSVTAKEAAYMGYNREEIRMVQEVSTKILGNIDEYTPGLDKNRAEELHSAAAQGAWTERLLTQVTGFFLGAAVTVQHMSNAELDEKAKEGRSAGYHPVENPGGSKRAKDLFKEMNPEATALGETWRIYGPNLFERTQDPEANYFDAARAEQDFTWESPYAAEARGQKNEELDLSYYNMGIEHDAYVTAERKKGRSEDDIYAENFENNNGKPGEIWEIKQKYYGEDGEIEQIKAKYSFLEETGDFNGYPYLAPEEAMIQSAYDLIDKVQADIPLTPYGDEKKSRSEYLEWKAQDDLDRANQHAAIELGMKDLSVLVAITAEQSPSGLGYPLEEEDYQQLVGALNKSGSPLEITASELESLANVQKKYEADNKWPKNIPERAGVFGVEGDAAQGLIETEKTKNMTPIQQDNYANYLESKSGGSGGSGGGGGGGGRRGGGGGGGGGYGAYAQRANIRVDPYRGLGSGLMVGANGNDYQWQAGNGQRWYAQREQTPLPKYRALGR